MKKGFLFLLVVPLCSCGVNLVSSSSEEPISSSSLPGSSSVPSVVECNVYKDVALPSLSGKITYTYSGKDIEIDETANTVCGTLANTSTALTMSNGTETLNLTVKVVNRAYASKHAATESSEGWFNDVTISPISGLSSSFAEGVDVSSCKQLYDAGQKFYNADGVEESLFRILKDNGVNWARFRLWNDPYNHNIKLSDGSYAPYGGGVCDLDHVTWMAREAKRFGLKVFIDFHYSDFWVDPTNQVMPKAWANFTTVYQLKTAINDYTTSVLRHLISNGAKPDMVSIGNENIAGMLLSKPGTDSTSYTAGNPDYISKKSALDSSLAGKIGTDNLVTYIKAGVDAVKAVDTSILCMIHMAKNLTAYEYIKTIYDNFASVNYDVIGLSGYSYWHFSTMKILKTAMDYLSAAFPGKKICLAETSYGYTYEEDSRCGNSFSATSSSCKPVSGYDVNVQGQATILRDTMAQVASISNGFGVFYWEGAWTATAFCGWGDKQSLCSWSNQGLFSYNGKALGSLQVYSKIRG
ncbi:MAG: Arabinogalactan endo-1,4-beta-galactosidase precursor [Tenericutes bacterium ADurb.BinA155]|nr:MAG: Arabinogalactan endo-1,4-beta-galactosidase precursor [Tenericutes bacterium ADurb.BinA155]